MCLSFNKVININLSPRERPDVEVKLRFTVQSGRKDHLEAERVRLMWDLLFDLPEQALGLCICFGFLFSSTESQGSYRSSSRGVQRSQAATI